MKSAPPPTHPRHPEAENHGCLASAPRQIPRTGPQLSKFGLPSSSTCTTVAPEMRQRRQYGRSFRGSDQHFISSACRTHDARIDSHVRRPYIDGHTTRSKRPGLETRCAYPQDVIVIYTEAARSPSTKYFSSHRRQWERRVHDFATAYGAQSVASHGVWMSRRTMQDRQESNTLLHRPAAN